MSDHDIDVAISFLNEDLGLANEIAEKLGNAMEVFVYAKKQEELAGTDGLESFRKVFRHRARLVVILHRDHWGKTPWTRVEEEAITDRFLKEGPSFLFVIKLDSSPPPPWVPEKLIRLSLSDFGVEQAVGAIKARAMEAGSVIHRPTTSQLARLAEEAAQFSKRRAHLLRSEEGVRLANDEAQRAIKLIDERMAEVQSAAASLKIEYATEENVCVVNSPGVGFHVLYENRIINVLDEAQLWVREYPSNLILPGQKRYYLETPHEIASHSYRPELTRSQGWCWADNDQVLTSEQVADRCVEQFLSLVRRRAAGELPKRWRR